MLLITKCKIFLYSVIFYIDKLKYKVNLEYGNMFKHMLVPYVKDKK